MKQPLAIRIDGEFLAAVRTWARRDNRTPTNLIETVLRHHLEQSGIELPQTSTDGNRFAQKDTQALV